MQRAAEDQRRKHVTVPRGRCLLAVALTVVACSAATACGDPTIARSSPTTATIAWNDISGISAAGSPQTTNAPPPTGSVVGENTAARILWSFPADGVEFIAVHDGVVYATTDTEVIAASLIDGTVLWRHQADDYMSDGESQIAADGQDLWVIAPYNSNIHLDRRTGTTLRVGALPEDEFPIGFKPLSSPAPTKWNVDNSDGGARAVLPDGQAAWQLVVTDSGEGGPVIADGDVTIVPATDRYVYAITTA